MTHSVSRHNFAQPIPLKQPRVPRWLAGLVLVLVLMAISAAAATYLALSLALPTRHAAEQKAAEAAAFKAGRETAYSELADGAVQVYQQGLQEGLRQQQGAQR